VQRTLDVQQRQGRREHPLQPFRQEIHVDSGYRMLKLALSEMTGTGMLALALHSSFPEAAIPLALFLGVYLFKRFFCHFNLSISTAVFASSPGETKFGDYLVVGLAQVLGAMAGNLTGYLLKGHWSSVVVPEVDSKLMAGEFVGTFMFASLVLQASSLVKSAQLVPLYAFFCLLSSRKCRPHQSLAHGLRQPLPGYRHASRPVPARDPGFQLDPDYLVTGRQQPRWRIRCRTARTRQAQVQGLVTYIHRHFMQLYTQLITAYLQS
jgi:hypothetical protein